MGRFTLRRHLTRGLAAFAFVSAALSSASLCAQSKATVLPEVILAVDTSESMQWSVADGKTVDCSASKPSATRWTAVQQMLTGTITDYKCVKESLPSFPDSLVTPKQVVGQKVCIGGLDHFISTRTAAKMPASSAAGDKSYSGSFLSPHSQLRLLISKEDIVLPYFSYELDGIDTTDKWVEGDLRLVTKDVSTVNSGDIWGYLVRMDKNPALMNGKVFICDLMTQSKSGLVTGPTKFNNTADGETLFNLNADALKTLQDDVKKGQKTFFFAVVSQKAWFKNNCSARGDDMTEKMDIKFHGHGSPWKDRRPRLEIGTGVQCPREGPGAHFSTVGSAGADGLLSTYVDAAKYALLVSDVSMSKANDAAGDFSFGEKLGTYWGEINIGMQDPFATGSQSSPIVRSEDSTSRLNGIDTIKKNIQSIQPHGGTPLGSFLQDISGYFGPGTYQDAHFQSSQSDPESGDPYFECRTRMVILFTDGGANLHTGITDGRSAALQAAADLWTKGIAVYVVVPGSKGISDTDLDFLDELALAGGTSEAWRVDTPIELNARLKTILQTVGTTGEVLTPTVMTSSTGVQDEVQHSFHARSNFDVTEPMQTWGILEQRIFGCSKTCVDEKSPGSAKVCEVIDYGQRLKDRLTPRALYSQVRGARTDLDERNISADDMLIAKTGLAPQLELDGNNNCVTKPNTFKLSNPAQRAAYAADVLSQIRGDGKSCRVNHLLGASGRSEMAHLGGADQVPLRDASFKTYAARVVPSTSVYSKSNPPGSTGRPGMLFVATHEGMLHAFRTDRSETTKEVSTAKMGDEIFAWMPAFNLQRIRQLRLVADADRSFLGGAVVTGHVQLDRLGNTIDELAQRWRAVVLVGAGEAGVGYTALDVTSPSDPRLLWEIAPNFHCFGTGAIGGAKGPSCLEVSTYVGLGRSTAKPVIGSLFTNWQEFPTTRSVAIIAGGKRPKDSEVTNLGVDGNGERAIWIVDMATGGLIRKLTTDDMDFTGMTTTVTSKHDLGYFWSAPACYETAPGQIISRCFIGDSRGMVWRLDLADPDPKKWKIRFFHDPYSAEQTPVSYHKALNSTERVPVYTPPRLSLQPDGTLVVVYGTGNARDEARSNRHHIVYSVKERIKTSLSGVGATVDAETLWLKVLKDNSRYIGPPTIFSRNAYWASYAVPPGGKCTLGTASIWGAHYTRRAVVSDAQSLMGAFPNPSTGSVTKNTLTNLIVGNSVPSAVNITPVPACVAGCAPTDLSCLINAKVSAAAIGKPQFKVNAGVASAAQGQYQKPNKGAQPQVGTITRSIAKPRSTTVVTGWDLLFD